MMLLVLASSNKCVSGSIEVVRSAMVQYHFSSFKCRIILIRQFQVNLGLPVLIQLQV